MLTIVASVAVGNSINLDMNITDENGNFIDADSMPMIQITDTNGTIVRALSSTDVQKLSTGHYRLTYDVETTASLGVWIETWQLSVGGEYVNQSFGFDVFGEEELIANIGDEPVIKYTQNEIHGLNILLSLLRARLKNNLEVETVDAYGNIAYEECSVFTDDELVWFLKCSLSEFNQTPHFTDFTFDMEVIHDRFAHVIVEGASILALASQMLIEAGRELSITDNGVSFNPPQLSTVLNNQLSQFVTTHRENLKYIKTSIKPRPTGFGTFRVLASNPNYLRLRHLRSRRII